jgi:hypothetical protein
MRLPRHRKGERFLKGPVPWPWLQWAARLPGKALHVGVALWQLAGMANTTTVKLSLSWLETELGAQRDAGRRALGALEGAGLVEVVRHPGRCPVVTILPADDPVGVRVQDAGPISEDHADG